MNWLSCSMSAPSAQNRTQSVQKCFSARLSCLTQRGKDLRDAPHPGSEPRRTFKSGRCA
ncbi:DUF1534 domain-containing protein [Pseudomonas caricapapayae]|nr:DUF1534 domain-containing protein [Pseudomonas caricapapayae]